MENIPDTPEGIILESLLEGMAEYYSAELSQKVKRGMNETRLKGNFTGGCILYGYKVKNHKVIIEDEEAENVKYIFKQYSLGIFAKDIVEELNQKHIYNRGKPFTTSSIYHMLKNEKYSGIYKFQNEIYDNIFPRIVPYETYNIVQKKIEVNKYGKKSNEVIYLLKGKLFCGHCGCPINGECGYSKTGAKNRYYKCNGRKKKNGCTKTMIRKEILEDFLINAVLEIINKPKYIDEIVNHLLLIQEKNANKNSRLSILLKDKKQNENNLNTMIKAVEQGLVSKTIIERMKVLEEEQSNLEKEIIIEQLKAKTKLTYDQILEYFLQALKMNPLLLVGYLIKEVKAYDDKIEIIYNNPINNDPDDKSQGFLFYSKTKKMKKTVLYKTDKNYIDILLNMYI